MDPFTAAAAIQTGGKLIGSIGSWLGGKGERERLEKNYKRSRSLLLGDLGKDIYDPEMMLSLLDVAQIPQMRAAGSQIARQTGNINAADASGALWEKLIGGRQQNYTDLKMTNEREKAARDAAIKRLLFSSDAQALGSY